MKKTSPPLASLALVSRCDPCAAANYDLLPAAAVVDAPAVVAAVAE